jgi:hypothetical protein
LKYLNTSENFDFGGMLVTEDDPDDAQGKQFLSGRWLIKKENGYFGQLVNFVDRQTIDRQATTTGFDFGYWQDELSIDGKLLYSNVSQESSVEGNIEGFGSAINFNIQGAREWKSALTLTWFDDQLELNDMGYLARNDIKKLDFSTDYLHISKGTHSFFSRFDWHFATGLKSNGHSEQLPKQFTFGLTGRTQSNASVLIQVNYDSSGIDDLISRGHGSVDLNSRQDWMMSYISPYGGKYHFQVDYHRFQEGIDDWADSLKYSMDYAFSDHAIASASLYHMESDDWLIGNSSGELTRYQRQFDQFSFNLLWLLAEGQELSLKSQWYALEAKNGQQYTYINVGLSEEIKNKQPSDFKQSQLSMQLRYRYRFAPLSDIYLVYVRNGSYYQEGDNLAGNRDIFNQQFDHPDENLLFFKIRKMF